MNSIAMLFCLNVQNFTELRPKNDFQYGGSPPVGARRHGQEGHLPSLENIQARFASTTIFWFIPKETKSFHKTL